MTKNKKPTLLLHSCCAPCTTAVYEKICNNFNATLFWFNPNIEPFLEYEKRLDELKKLSKILKIELIVDDKYAAENQNWNLLVRNFTDEKEGGNRCRLCIKSRLLSTAKYGKDNNFDYFATTLTISPHKNSKMINEIGKNIEAKINADCHPEIVRPERGRRVSGSGNHNPGFQIQACLPVGRSGMTIKFLDEDFKKENGYLRSIELSKKYGLYRQNYCGCQYSLQNSNH
ncbi:MAG: epoxyqueuosine reductase QueH [Patescibacteria group bacterium]